MQSSILYKNKSLEFFAVLAVVLILLMFNWRILATKELMAAHDAIGTYGQFYYLADSISHGVFPYWNPYMNAGEPYFISLMADNMLSPVVIFWALLAIVFKFSFLTAWHWILFSYFLIFALGCYFLFRTVLEYKISTFIAFAVISFSSLSVIFWWQWGLIHSVYALSWLLLCAFEIFKNNKINFLIPFSFLLGLSCISLYSIYLLCFCFAFFSFLFLTGAFPDFNSSIFGKNKKIIILSLLIFAAIVFQLVPVFLYKNDVAPVLRMLSSNIAKDIRPTFEGIGGATSTMFDFLVLFCPPFFLNFFKSRFLLPGMQEGVMYIGLIPLIIFFIGIFYGRHKYKLGIILTLIFTIFLMLGKKSFLLQFAYYFFPGFSLIRNMDFFLPYFIFIMAFLVGIGMDRILKDVYANERQQLKKYLKLPLAMYFLYAVFLGSLIFVLYFLALPKLKLFMIDEAFSIKIIEELSMSLTLLFETFWHVLFFLFWAVFFFYILPIKQVILRHKMLILCFLIIFELLSLDYLLARQITQPRISNPPEYQTPVKYEEFRLDRIKNDAVFAWYGPALYKKFTAYIDEFATCTHFIELKSFYEFKNSQITERAKNAMLGITAPKIRLFSRAIVGSPDKIIDFIENYPASEGKIEVTKFDINRLELKIFAKEESILYYSDSYDKYWEATIDGQKTEIYKTSAFKSIILPAGEHSVKFIYNPWLFKIGLYAYFLVLICLVIYLMFKSNAASYVRLFLAVLRRPFSRKIEHLILYPTGRCNLQCSHCFAYEQNVKDNDLSFEEIKKIAKIIPNPLWFDIGGGEPFLREDLAEICELFNAEKITIPTNGWFSEKILQTAKKLAVKKPNKIVIVISFEGPLKIHNSIRGEGSFERALQTFKLLKEIKNIRVGFSTTLTNRNTKEIISFIKDMKQYQPDFHGIILLRGKSRDQSLTLPSLDEIKRVENDFRELVLQDKYGGGLRATIEKNFVAYRRYLASRILKEKKQILPCLAGQNHLVIFSNGDAHPCELLPSVGNIKMDSLSEILKSEALKQSIAKIHSGACYCTHECNMLDNILLNPLCYFNLFWQKK